MHSSAMILGLVVSAMASPLYDTSRFSRRQDEPFNDKAKLCGLRDLSNPDGARAAWEETGAASFLDNFITNDRKGDPTDWVKILERLITGDPGTNADGCSSVKNECNPGIEQGDCATYFDTLTEYPNQRLGYWVFMAVNGLHQKLTALYNELFEKTMLNTLAIPTMVEKLGGDQGSGGDVLKWLTAAAGAGGAVAGMSPNGAIVGGGLSFLSAMFGAAAEEEKDLVDDIGAAMGAAFEKTSARISRALGAAVGRATDPGDYNALPAGPGSEPFQSSIAKFFSGGWWLLENDSADVTGALQATVDAVKMKVVDQILQSSGYYLLVDRHDNTLELCGTPLGRQWMPVRVGEADHCMYVAKVGEGLGSFYEAPAEVYEAMAEYGLGNRMAYYRILLDCALNSAGDPSVRTDALVPGQIPLCYFNMKAVYLDRQGCETGSDGFYTCQSFTTEDVK
ncbi:hypothetical protein BN1708_009065 [Verticillium longisporum]|uniref:Uncharacterized protein n=1 Tax=Verticillium longisporum TaxID=100787 RepID=A0A0G4KEZ7_VERLO|nr:hypothetical protein BN1708_009065 [Verticillium longisporum]